MGGRKVVQHLDIDTVLESAEWQAMAFAISKMLNRYWADDDTRSAEAAMRAVAYALQVAPIASTCKQCRPNASPIWPYLMTETTNNKTGERDGVRAVYWCDKHGEHSFLYSWKMLNRVDISGLA